MKHAKILGTGSYLPAQRVTNEELARRVDTSDEWITTRTGIKARHIAAEHEKTSRRHPRIRRCRYRRRRD